MPFSSEKRKAYDAARAKVRGATRSKEARAAYDAARTEPRKGHAKNCSSGSRPFVAIDSEGADYGPEMYTNVASKSYTFYAHRTFLWHASQIAPHSQESWLRDEKMLDSERILDWISNLPGEFPNCIFVAFAFSYDVVQALKDLPLDALTELQHECPMDRIGDPTYKKPRRYSIIWKKYKIAYRKGKWFSVQNIQEKKKPCMIYDVFGYFQCRFLDALGGQPVDPTDIKIIIEGKQRRIAFDPVSDMRFAMKYTAAECRALCAVMENVRKGVEAIGLKPSAWHGPGALASAAIRKYGVREHMWRMKRESISPQQRWAHHAYFGGRIELTMRGIAEKLYGYDINSAYPAICTKLPSMSDGKWIYHKRVTPEQIEDWSLVSMVHVATEGRPKKVNLFPLPYRTRHGAILFPECVNGYYMVDEVRAALDYCFEHPPMKVMLKDAWEFVPDNDVLPFAFVGELYEERKAIPKTDIRNKVIKLMINSIYGKLAQAVGNDVPPDACVWYAAAITAGTRAALLRAATEAPEDIVMLATDGIVSRAPIDVPISKALGEWESGTVEGAVYVKSGIYTYKEDDSKEVTKSRGVSPEYLDTTKGEWIRSKVIEAWKAGKTELEYPYRSYVTLGQAIASEGLRAAFGCWIYGRRTIDIGSIGNKRVACAGRDGRKCRPWEGLDGSEPRSLGAFDGEEGSFFDEAFGGEIPLSTISRPEWLSSDELWSEREQEEIMLAWL